MKKLKFPAPYFGGKSIIANIVWQYLGDPKRYIEPFFGSGAVLLARELTNDDHTRSEIVNDRDGFITNVWRALQFDPDEVAKWCDWPVNHADLIARRNELRLGEECLTEKLCSDSMYYDAKMAGYWLWCASCWIGRGLTRKTAIPRLSENAGVHTVGQIPRLSDNAGVHTVGQIPILTNNQGPTTARTNDELYLWFRRLQDRMRHVKVVCGDWSRVCGGQWQDDNGICGMFFDPPYGAENRDTTVYHHDSVTVAKDVEKWCLDRGKKETMRIVIAGYVEEYQSLLKAGWTTHRWKAGGGYSNQGKNAGNNNRNRETLFVSPHCVNKGML